MSLPPLPAPPRLSQTLLARADCCPRSAYLYLKYLPVQASNHAMHRGSVFHAFAEKATLLLKERGEPKLDPDTAKVLVDEVLDDHPDLHIERSAIDDVRVMAFHWAEWFELTAACAVETKYVAELQDWPVSGKVDLIDFYEGPRGPVARIRDYKTSWQMRATDDYRRAFQPRMYALLVAANHPEVREVECQELYPRYAGLPGPDALLLDQTEIADFRHDIERLLARVGRQFTVHEWPAVWGSHCDSCAAPAECPLPATLRPPEAVDSQEQAEEALTYVEAVSRSLDRLRRGAREWAKEHDGRVRVGTDLVYDFAVRESVKADWAAIEGATQRGERVDLAAMVKRRPSTEFRKRKLRPEERAT